jgi:hypothetical protein
MDIKEKMGDKEMADIYGSEHLLRLFVRLPYLLAQTNVTEAEMVHIQNKVSGLQSVASVFNLLF